MKAESATIVRAIVALKESNAANMKGQAIAGQTMKTEDMYGKAAQPAGLCGTSSLGAGVQIGAKAGKEVQAAMRQKQLEYATMALTIVADSAFIVPIMFCAASRISERMASPSAVVWAFTICTVCPRFIVSIPLIVPQSQPLANVWAGIARTNMKGQAIAGQTMKTEDVRQSRAACRTLRHKLAWGRCANRGKSQQGSSGRNAPEAT